MDIMKRSQKKQVKISTPRSSKLKPNQSQRQIASPKKEAQKDLTKKILPSTIFTTLPNPPKIKTVPKSNKDYFEADSKKVPNKKSNMQMESKNIVHNDEMSPSTPKNGEHNLFYFHSPFFGDNGNQDKATEETIFSLSTNTLRNKFSGNLTKLYYQNQSLDYSKNLKDQFSDKNTQNSVRFDVVTIDHIVKFQYNDNTIIYETFSDDATIDEIKAYVGKGLSLNRVKLYYRNNKIDEKSNIEYFRDISYIEGELISVVFVDKTYRVIDLLNNKICIPFNDQKTVYDIKSRISTDNIKIENFDLFLNDIKLENELKLVELNYSKLDVIVAKKRKESKDKDIDIVFYNQMGKNNIKRIKVKYIDIEKLNYNEIIDRVLELFKIDIDEFIHEVIDPKYIVSNEQKNNENNIGSEETKCTENDIIEDFNQTYYSNKMFQIKKNDTNKKSKFIPQTAPVKPTIPKFDYYSKILLIWHGKLLNQQSIKLLKDFGKNIYVYIKPFYNEDSFLVSPACTFLKDKPIINLKEIKFFDLKDSADLIATLEYNDKENDLTVEEIKQRLIKKYYPNVNEYNSNIISLFAVINRQIVFLFNEKESIHTLIQDIGFGELFVLEQKKINDKKINNSIMKNFKKLAGNKISEKEITNIYEKTGRDIDITVSTIEWILNT